MRQKRPPETIVAGLWKISAPRRLCGPNSALPLRGSARMRRRPCRYFDPFRASNRSLSGSTCIPKLRSTLPRAWMAVPRVGPSREGPSRTLNIFRRSGLIGTPSICPRCCDSGESRAGTRVSGPAPVSNARTALRATLTRTLESFWCDRVFREGAENSARDGRASNSISDFEVQQKCPASGWRQGILF